MKRKFSLYILLLLALVFFSCKEKSIPKVYTPIAEGNHPFNAKIYELDNGLTVCLSVNKKEPRVHTFVGIKTGSKNDPQHATGLAHYLEHMLFKGTSKLGSVNWEKEKPYLDTIAALYETHRGITDSLERLHVYQQIDSYSYLASNYAIANEYDKINSELGAQGTNAYTSMDETVYTTDIPVSELEKWMMIEAERFSELVLRLFHTEIEAVYEEFNISQDRDDENTYDAVMKSLFRKHTYGTQTTIGKGEHLKNPSMKEIQAYFKTYYVPNNMVISISGDIHIDSTLALVDRYFGHYTSAKVPSYRFKKEDLNRKPDTVEVFGREAEYCYLAYRLEGADSKDRLYLELIDGILNNGRAGLIDLNLLTGQKVLNAWSYPVVNKDYSVLMMAGYPKYKQPLEKVSELLQDQIDKIKKGDFPDWLPQAVVNNLKLEAMESMTKNRARANNMLYAYLHDTGWEKESGIYDEMAKISKQDIIHFANIRLVNNHVLVYKREGDRNPYKVVAPKINPIRLRKDTSSTFYNEVTALPSRDVEAQFVDFSKAIKSVELENRIKVNCVSNTENDLFALHYVFDFGKWSDRELALAIEYLPFLGTTRHTAEALKQSFFKKGLRFDSKVKSNQIVLSIRGLESSFEEGLELMEHIIRNVKPNKRRYQELVRHKLKKQRDSKLDKEHLLWRGMMNYVKYGFDNPENYVLSKAQLLAIKPEKLIKKIRGIFDFEHEVFYYGHSSAEEIAPLIAKHHKLKPSWKDSLKEKTFTKNEEDFQIYFLHQDMVQAEIIFLAEKGLFNPENMGFSRLFNEYIGNLTFRELRESKALAYSCYTSYAPSPRVDYADYILAYVGTQSDKFNPAVDAMFEILKQKPTNGSMFEESKSNVLKNIASNRTTGEDIIWSYLKNLKKGITIDINRPIYQYTNALAEENFSIQFNQIVVPSDFKIIVIGDKELLDTQLMDRFGKLKKLSIPDVFSY